MPATHRSANVSLLTRKLALVAPGPASHSCHSRQVDAEGELGCAVRDKTHAPCIWGSASGAADDATESSHEVH